MKRAKHDIGSGRSRPEFAANNNGPVDRMVSIDTGAQICPGIGFSLASPPPSPSSPRIEPLFLSFLEYQKKKKKGHMEVLFNT